MRKILIVDDNPANIDTLITILYSYDVSVAINGSDALDQIGTEHPDVILMDINLPGQDGFELCALLKRDPKTRDIPVLFLSVNTDMPSKIRAFDAGGVDYIEKPFHPREVLARVRTHLKLKLAMEAMEKLAREDPLTGIANRRYFYERAQSLMTQSQVGQLCLVLIDFDRFKEINDTYGHLIGDAVLQTFVTIVSETAQGHCFARLGGDEFALLLQMEEDAARQITEAICHRVADTPHFLLGKQVSFSVSYGLSVLQPEDEDVTMMMRRADQALYRHKHRKEAVILPE